MQRLVRLFLSVIFFIALNAANGQKPVYIQGGLSLSTIRAAFTEVNLNKVNVLAGVGVIFPTENEHFYFALEGNFAQKGNRTANPTPGITAEQTRASLLYFQVPGYAAYRFDEHWSAFIGPALGVLLFTSEENRFSINGTPTDFTNFELSALIGVKYNLGDHWGAALRFEHSVLSVVSVPPELRQLRGARRYHAAAGFTIFYTFN